MNHDQTAPWVHISFAIWDTFEYKKARKQMNSDSDSNEV